MKMKKLWLILSILPIIFFGQQILANGNHCEYMQAAGCFYLEGMPPNGERRMVKIEIKDSRETFKMTRCMTEGKDFAIGQPIQVGGDRFWMKGLKTYHFSVSICKDINGTNCALVSNREFTVDHDLLNSPVVPIKYAVDMAPYVNQFPKCSID
jgi:hypothetical protein